MLLLNSYPMRVIAIIFCILIILLSIFFIATDHADALFDLGTGSRNPPLLLVLILAVIGLWANLKKQY